MSRSKVGIIAFIRACPSGLASKAGKHFLMTSSTIFTETEAPGEAPSSAEMLHAAWTGACRHALEALVQAHPHALEAADRWVTGFETLERGEGNAQALCPGAQRFLAA